MPNALVRSLRHRIVTAPYPVEGTAAPPRLRGRPALNGTPSGAGCCAEGACARACPTEAISLDPGWQVDLGKCLFCGLCADACPTGTLQLTGEFELATSARDDLRVGPDGAPACHLTPTAIMSGGAQTNVSAPPAAVRTVEAGRIEGRLRERIARALRRSLHIRHLDAGSCNGCDWELTSLLNPVHDLQRLGFDFVASPRHADLLLVTGVMTRNLTTAALRTYEAMPEPRLVVAVGACGCSGGIFPTNYTSGGGVDSVLPVDVYIPGCPPRPQALLYGLLLAVGRIEQRLGSATATSINPETHREPPAPHMLERVRGGRNHAEKRSSGSK